VAGLILVADFFAFFLPSTEFSLSLISLLIEGELSSAYFDALALYFLGCLFFFSFTISFFRTS
jgi:hypothetical protein